MFISRPAKELLWGYNDTLLTDVDTLLGIIRHVLPKKLANFTPIDPFIGLQVCLNASVSVSVFVSVSVSVCVCLCVSVSASVSASPLCFKVRGGDHNDRQV